MIEQFHPNRQSQVAAMGGRRDTRY
jgi:hypothetical protein